MRLQLAPILKALWEAEALSEESLIAWAENGSSAKAKKFSAPFIEWLKTAEVVDVA